MKSRWRLTSGNLEFVSDGKKVENSPFAKYLTNYLKSNLKDKLLVSQLVQAAKIAVADNTKQIPFDKPLKKVGNEGGEFIFYHHDEKRP